MGASSSIEARIAQLHAAIAAQSTLRPSMGDAVVDATIAALRAQGDTAAGATAAPVDVAAVAALQAYIPRELAGKMRAGGRIEGERRQVTVLFADLSGYTALSETLDPEDVAALSDAVLHEFAECVYQYEGYVERYAGDSVLALFGAPVAHEDDPERALRAALAMCERLEDVNRRWTTRLPHPLRLHVGVNTGLVVAGDVGHDLRLQYTVMGDTINTAARLQAAAQPGEIVVGRETYRLTFDAFTFEALDPITVKGKRDPLVVFALQRARPSGASFRPIRDLRAERSPGRGTHLIGAVEVVGPQFPIAAWALAEATP